MSQYLHEERFTFSLSQEKDLLITDLFPNDIENKPFTNLEHRLKEYRLLLVAAYKAFLSYVNGHFSDFDALVGENSCQIRATMMHAIKPHISITQLEEEIVRLEHLIEKVDQTFEFMKGNDFSHPMKLTDYLKTHHLDYHMTKIEVFLTISYILTMVRIFLPPSPDKLIVRNESTKTNKVKQISPVGSSFGRELVKRLRNILSIMSVDFVKIVTQEYLLNQQILKMVTGNHVVEFNKFGHLKCLPCFWYTYAVLEYARVQKVPILLVVDLLATDQSYESKKQLRILFTSEGEEFKQEDLSDLVDRNFPVLIIEGCCCRPASELEDSEMIRQEILTKNVRDLILAYAAAHRQYPDESHDVLVQQDPSYMMIEEYTHYANEWGCSLNNPSLFFLVHVYSDQLSHRISA